jgi:DNA-directed RNA polymerase beta' subunit
MIRRRGMRHSIPTGEGTFCRNEMKNRNISGINRDIQIDSEEVRNRWKQYIEVLYQGSRALEENLMKGDSETDYGNPCPYILWSEFLTAVIDLRKTNLENTNLMEKSSKR